MHPRVVVIYHSASCLWMQANGDPIYCGRRRQEMDAPQALGLQQSTVLPGVLWVSCGTPMHLRVRQAVRPSGGPEMLGGRRMTGIEHDKGSNRWYEAAS
jgi:hypothetical protein